ncbi:MAG: motility-associated protein, partial [Pseudomonadota bacterium]
MLAIVGLIVTLVMVFGGYVIAGGKLGIILASLPYEMMMIGGAALGAFLVANDMHGIKHTLGDFGAAISGAKWKKQDYQDLLCLMHEMIVMFRESPVDIEAHIEDPAGSSLFAKYPRIQADKAAVDILCDTIRSMMMNFDDVHQVEELLEKQLEAQKEERLHGAHAISNIADALPALGIVAAVLGVIKTMASIDKPPEILGKMIGGALVGTFLGVFL